MAIYNKNQFNNKFMLLKPLKKNKLVRSQLNFIKDLSKIASSAKKGWDDFTSAEAGKVRGENFEKWVDNKKKEIKEETKGGIFFNTDKIKKLKDKLNKNNK